MESSNSNSEEFSHIYDNDLENIRERNKQRIRTSKEASIFMNQHKRMCIGGK